MNFFALPWQQAWESIAWTMCYFFVWGTIIASAGALLRFLARRAAPTIRYTISLTVFAALAVTPIGIAAWLIETTAITAPSISPPPSPPNIVKPNIAPPSGREITPFPPLAVAETSRPEDGAIYIPLMYRTVEYLPWLWIVGAPFTFLLLATGLIGSERLRRGGTPIAAGIVSETCVQLRKSLHITREVSLALCDRVAQPVLVGIVRPLILLPPAALTGWSPDELEMVLLHELAHVRRWDNLVNLLQRIVESLLFFHPVVWLVSRQVRRDREQCCDAVVVAHTAAPQAYAELLVSIASKGSSSSSLATASAMADHPLTARIRRILKLEDEPMLVSRRTLGFTVLVAVLILVVVLWQPAKKTIAEESGTTAEEEKVETEDMTEHVPGLALVMGENAKIDIAIEVPPKLSTPKQHQSIVNSLKKQGYRARVATFEGSDGERGFLLVITVPAGSNPKVVWEGHTDGLQPRLILADSTTKYYEPEAYSQPPQEIVSPELRGRELEFEIRDAKKRIEFMKISFQLGQQKYKAGMISQTEILKHKYELDRAELQLERLQARLSEITEQISSEKQKRTLLYAGKTFDQWREMWKTELKTEKRTECINALAAFARAGHGKEAAETILDVAREYDFTTYDNSAEGKLKQRVLDMLSKKTPASQWLTSLLERYNTDEEKWGKLTRSLLQITEIIDEPSRQQLLNIANSDHSLHELAVGALIQNDLSLEHPETEKLVHKALQGEHPILFVLHSLDFQHLDKVPEQFDLLFHENVEVRKGARRALPPATNSRQVVIDKLLAVLNDPAQREKHADVIRALSRFGDAGPFGSNEKIDPRITLALLKTAREGDDQLLGPAIVALSRIRGQTNSVNTRAALLDETPENSSISEDRKKLLNDAAAIEELVQQEERFVPPLDPSRGGGGGGGFF